MWGEEDLGIPTEDVVWDRSERTYVASTNNRNAAAAVMMMWKEMVIHTFCCLTDVPDRE